MVSIGKRKVIFSEIVLCPEDERIELQVQVPGEEELWMIEVYFTEDEVKPGGGKSPKPNLSWVVEDEVWKFNFKNWHSSLGAAIAKPAEVAVSTGGLSIKMLANVAKISSLYRINFQFMVEEDIHE